MKKAIGWILMLLLVGSLPWWIEDLLTATSLEEFLRIISIVALCLYVIRICMHQKD